MIPFSYFAWLVYFYIFLNFYVISSYIFDFIPPLWRRIKEVSYQLKVSLRSFITYNLLTLFRMISKLFYFIRRCRTIRVFLFQLPIYCLSIIIMKIIKFLNNISFLFAKSNSKILCEQSFFLGGLFFLKHPSDSFFTCFPSFSLYDVLCGPTDLIWR